jgi:hypothetical protein
MHRHLDSGAASDDQRGKYGRGQRRETVPSRSQTPSDI